MSETIISGIVVIGGLVGALLVGVALYRYLSLRPGLLPVERIFDPLVADLADRTYEWYAAQAERWYPTWPKEDKRRLAIMLGNQCLEQMADFRSRIGYRPGVLA